MTFTVARPAGVERGGIPLARNKRLHILELTVSSYTAAGETITAAALGLKRIDVVVPVIIGGVAAARTAYWDRANSKLIIAETGAAVNGVFSDLEAAATATVLLLVLGR